VRLLDALDLRPDELITFCVEALTRSEPAPRR